MTLVLDAALPIFALILTGYLLGRRGTLGPAATDSLNLFVVWLALPALLFQVMAGITWAQIDHPGFVLAFGGGMVATYLVSFLLGRTATRHPRHRLADASIEGLDAAYGNSGFMGIPLCLAIFGPVGLPAAVIATLLTACALFAVSITLIELDLQGGRLRGAAGKVVRSLALNPLLAAPVAGCVFAAAGLSLPGPVLRYTTLLGGAASPCALVTIGLFLAQGSAAGDARIVARLVGLKLLVQPVVTAVLAFGVFGMPPLWSHTALLLSALPTGTGPFMLAKLYDREAAVTSRAILISTVLSVLTVPPLIALFGRP